MSLRDSLSPTCTIPSCSVIRILKAAVDREFIRNAICSIVDRYTVNTHEEWKRFLRSSLPESSHRGPSPGSDCTNQMTH